MAKITVQQISRRAKKIRKPGEKWLTAIRRASKELKGGKKVSATKFIERGETKRTPAKTFRRVRTKSGLFKSTKKVSGINNLGAAMLKSELRKRLNERIDKLVVRRYHATTKRERNKIQQSINDANAELRRLS